jgi:hypothetical protein
MKNYLILFLFCFASLFAKAQKVPSVVPRSSPALTVQDARFRAQLNLYLPVVNDTSSALNGGLDSVGAVVQIRGTGDLYKRDTVITGGHRWTLIGIGAFSSYTFLGNVTGSTAPGVYLPLSTLNVKWFHAVGDSLTDDLAAFQACYDALPAMGGRIEVPAGKFLWSGTFRTIPGKPVEFIGVGGKALTYGPNFTTINNVNSTQIFMNSLTDTCFYNAANGTRIENVSFVCDRGTTASTNIGIYLDSGSNVKVYGVGLKNFNYNFTLRYGVQYNIEQNVSINPHSVGYNFQSYDGIDAGDGYFINNQAYATPGFTYISSDTCLKIKNGGGFKARLNKLGGSQYGTYAEWSLFSDVRFENNSIEAATYPFEWKLQPSGSIANMHITDNQMIASGLRVMRIDVSNGLNAQQLIIDRNILEGPAISQDTGLILIGTFISTKIGRMNTFKNCAVPVYTSITNGYGSSNISIDVAPGVQAVTESPRMKIDLNKGNVITVSLTSNNDTIEFVNSGTANNFELQIGAGASVSNIVLATGSFNYSQANSFNIALQAGLANLVHGRTVTPSTFIIQGVDHQWTNGSIPIIANNGIQQDASNYFYDFTNKRIGLGTNAPGYAFHTIRGDGVTGFADQTNAWTKEFYTNQGLSNTNIIRLISGAGTPSAKLNAIGGMMNGIEFGYIDDLGNRRSSAGLYSRAEAAPTGSTGAMPTKIGIATYNIAQGFTTRNQPWTTGNVRQIWHSNGQIVSGIIVPADTIPQSVFRQTIRGSSYFDDDSVFRPNLPYILLDTTNYKLIVRNSSGQEFYTNWQNSGRTFGSSTQSGNGSTTSFTIAHGLSGVSSTSYLNLTPRTSGAGGFTYVTTDATNITIFYTIPPPSGSNNLIWTYEIKP